MPLNITVTKRKIKNRSTGIDLSVGSYDPAPSAKLVKNYHVVVITHLPHFKRPEHGEDDVIQFMIRRDYAAFEKLQKDILFVFPDLKLPSFPRKFHVFMTESDIEERMVSFDCIVKLIAKNKQMCTSSPILDFLGFSHTSDKVYLQERKKFLKKKEEEDEKEKDVQVFDDQLAADKGLFNTSSEEPFSDEDSQNKTHPFTVDSIFEDSDVKEKTTKKSAKISVLEEVEGRPLFVANDGSPKENPTRHYQLEDNFDLLNVTDTLEDVFKIAEKKQPVKKVSLISSSEVASGSGGLFDDTTDNGVSDMGTDDIMKYIQQNQDTGDDNLDLF